MKGAEEAELVVIVEVAEKFFGRRLGFPNPVWVKAAAICVCWSAVMS